MIRTSETKKLPGPSWSLEAKKTCPGSFGEVGYDGERELVDACKTCYAAEGNYRRPTVKAPREENRTDWKRDEWVDDMVKYLYEYSEKEYRCGRDPVVYFRWFDSGDCFHHGLACKIWEVASRTPWVKHWLPTRMYKFDKFAGIFHELAELHNMAVRFSSDSATGERLDCIPHDTGDSTIIPDKNWFEEGTPERMVAEEIERETSEAGVFICIAYKQGGKCGECRTCWDKGQQSIAYISHGRPAKKLAIERIEDLLEVEYAGIS